MILIDSSIDIHALVYANLDKFDTKKVNMNETPHPYNFFVHLFLNQVIIRKKFFKVNKNNRMYLAFDCRSWRKAFFESVKDKYFEDYYKVKKVSDEGYKAHREKSEMIDWTKIYELVDNIIYFLNTYTDIPCLKIENTEADDIIGYLTLQHENENIVIVSGDKDFKQLLTRKNVRLYNGIKGSYVEVNDPKMFLQHHIIMGDKGDEVPAIQSGVGEKKALKMLPIINDLLLTDDKLRYRYEINKKLIDLTCIPVYITDEIKNGFDKVNKNFNFDGTEVMSFLGNYDCRKLLQNYSDFKLGGDELGLDEFNISDDISESEKTFYNFLDLL